MPVPDTNTFTLLDVVAEIPGGQTSLQNCITDAKDESFDPRYATPPVNDQLSFRNYDNVPPYWALNPCTSGSLAYTRLQPAGASQRYIDPGTGFFYTWNGSVLSSPTPPGGFNGSIQRIDGQFNCP